jgi:hypothetical protein
MIGIRKKGFGCKCFGMLDVGWVEKNIVVGAILYGCPVINYFTIYV